MLDAHVRTDEPYELATPQVVVSEPSEHVRHLVAHDEPIRLTLETDDVVLMTRHSCKLGIRTDALDDRSVDVFVEADVVDEVDCLIEGERLRRQEPLHHVLDGVAQRLLRRALGEALSHLDDSVDVLLHHALSAR